MKQFRRWIKSTNEGVPNNFIIQLQFFFLLIKTVLDCQHTSILFTIVKDPFSYLRGKKSTVNGGNRLETEIVLKL